MVCRRTRGAPPLGEVTPDEIHMFDSGIRSLLLTDRPLRNTSIRTRGIRRGASLASHTAACVVTQEVCSFAILAMECTRLVPVTALSRPTLHSTLSRYFTSHA